MAFEAPAIIDITQVTPRPYGLLTVADVTTANRIPGSVDYSWPTSDAVEIESSDVSSICTALTTQTTDGIQRVKVASYDHRASRTCSLIGGNDYEAQALAVLNLTEDYAAQAQLNLIIGADANVEDGLTITTLPASATGDLALAAAAQAFATASALRPVYHVNVKSAVLLHEHYRLAGDHLEAKSGGDLAVEPLLQVGGSGDVVVATGPIFVQSNAAVAHRAPTVADNTETVQISRQSVLTVLGPIVVAPIGTV